jgi:hypothetical protein
MTPHAAIRQLYFKKSRKDRKKYEDVRQILKSKAIKKLNNEKRA